MRVVVSHIVDNGFRLALPVDVRLELVNPCDVGQTLLFNFCNDLILVFFFFVKFIILGLGYYFFIFRCF